MEKRVGIKKKEDTSPARRALPFVFSSVLAASFFLTLFAYLGQTYRFRLRRESILFNFTRRVPFRKRVEEALRRAVCSVDVIDLRSDGVGRVAALVSECGWVRRVLWVRVEGNSLRIGVALRRVCAALARRGRLWLCDEQANIIPCAVKKKEVRKAGLVVVRAGGVRRWEKAALKICRIVYDNREVFRAYGVKIEEVQATRGGRFVLVSSDGRVFEWGYAPGGPGVDYLSVREKLTNLELVLRNTEAKGCARVMLWSGPVGRPSDGPMLRRQRRQ